MFEAWKRGEFLSIQLEEIEPYLCNIITLAELLKFLQDAGDKSTDAIVLCKLVKYRSDCGR
jgi:hypothetical protein